MSGFGGNNFGGGAGINNNSFGGGGGGRSNNSHNSNNSWGGGGGGRNSSRGGRSGGRNTGRGQGRGRSSYVGNNYNSNYNRNNNSNGPRGLISLCKNFTQSGNCQQKDCSFVHAIKVHATIEASSPSNNNSSNNSNNNNGYNNNNNNKKKMHPVTSVAVWETGGNVKIFTGGKDGFWRLWSFNAQASSFVKEFESQMGGPVESLVVASNFLFCGFEGFSKSLPKVAVGMVHAWNLASPNDPPLEFHMQPEIIPYAHPTAVKKLVVVEGQKIISGSKDGSIKLWTFEPPSATNPKGGFMLTQNLLGHAREITGLVDVGSMLWTCSTEGSIRIWDMAKPGAPCQHCIGMASPNDNNNHPSSPANTGGQSDSNNDGPGHTSAVTGLVKFKSAAGNFVISCSLDGTVKAWDGGTGQCVASENHGEGVVTMSMIGDMNGKPCLLLGCESGTMYIRNIEPTAKVQQAFSPLMQLSSYSAVCHEGAVRSLCQGPSGTFYTAGDDGKVLVYQLTGDLGL